MIDGKDLNQIREHIAEAIPTLDQPNTYGHNVIAACLRLIAKEHGQEAANDAIRDLKLDKRGWNVNNG